MAGVIHHYLAARAELTAPGAPFATTTIEVRGVPITTFANMPATMRDVECFSQEVAACCAPVVAAQPAQRAGLDSR